MFFQSDFQSFARLWGIETVNEWTTVVEPRCVALHAKTKNGTCDCGETLHDEWKIGGEREIMRDLQIAMLENYIIGKLRYVVQDSL